MSKSPSSPSSPPSEADQDFLDHLRKSLGSQDLAALARKVKLMSSPKPAKHMKSSISILPPTQKQPKTRTIPVKAGDWQCLSDDVQEDISTHGLSTTEIYRNPSVPLCYELALKHEKDTHLADNGALCVRSGRFTGRTPQSKRIVMQPSTTETIDWGAINIPLPARSFELIKSTAINYLNTRDRLYVVDCLAGWDPVVQIKIRIIAERAYHALFCSNMFIIPPVSDLVDFKPDYTIFNAGAFPANPHVPGVNPDTKACIALDFESKEIVILGSQYAGEMKKSMFSVMHYVCAARGILTLHSSCNFSKDPKNPRPTIFLGLSGTGKTTLSTSSKRYYLGDDEIVWSDSGLSNIEAGSYAKVINLSAEKEPEIYQAIKYGSVLENVILDHDTRIPDWTDTSITLNTRCAYPLPFVPGSVIPAHIPFNPTAIVMLTCDAFGVLPPVSILSPAQASYMFLCGFTAKVAGTVQGITEPVPVFSAGFGAAFLPRHPTVYGDMLAEKMKKHNCHAYLVNTGWTGGPYGVGKRMSLPATRHIIDAINDGKLEKVETHPLPYFDFKIPKSVPNVDSHILDPKNTWTDKAAYDLKLRKLVAMFNDNFAKNFASQASDAVKACDPSFSK